MKSYSVVFTPESQEQILSIYRYIAEHGSPERAARYVDAIVSYCEGLSGFPHRGTCRNDIRPGLRITHYKRRAVIAFEVDDQALSIAVLGVFYGGRDYESVLNPGSDLND